MCINSRIQQLQQQKAELDAKIAKLEQFDRASSVIRGLLEDLIKDYEPIAPDELNDFLGELAMTLNNANDESDIEKPEGFDELVETYYSSGEFAAITSDEEDEDEQSTKIAIALTEQYREPNNPQKLSQNAEYLEFGAILERWGFNVWNDEQDPNPIKAIGLPVESDFVTTHKNWDIFFNIPNGGVTAVQLKSPAGNIYDRSTEPAEYGFPEDLSLAEVNKICEWTKQIIDGLEYGLVPGERLVTPAEEECNEISVKPENFDSDANQIPLPPTNSGTEKPAEFTEFIKLNNAVGYLKRRDNGEILSGYLGFSNKTPEGDRAPTMAKSRAAKWAEWLTGTFQMKCSEPRQPKRIISENPKQPFSYEIKISKPSIGHLQKLAEQNFNLLPNEEAGDKISSQTQPATKLVSSELTFSVAINGYSFKSGDEEEMRGIFEEEILKLSPIQLNVDLYKGATKLERWNFHDLSFTNCTDFDELNPEYNVFHPPSNTSVKVWSSLRSTAEKTERLWRHNLLEPGEEVTLPTREAAAVHATRRSQSQSQFVEPEI